MGGGGVEWQKVENKFLVGSGSNYAVKSEGGQTHHVHTYGIELGFYYGAIQGENLAMAGCLRGGAKNQTVGFTAAGRSAEGVVNNAVVTSNKTVSANHQQSITNTSSDPHIPPYRSVYIWRRIS